MGSIYPVPVGRASDTLLRTRMLAQLQSDQRKLLLVQDQVSTGRLFARPSDAPQATVRAMTLQRVIELKEQYTVNISTGDSFLAASDSAITGALASLRDIRGSVLSAINTTTTPTQRQAIIEEIKGAITFLTDLGNTQFRGRYLFSGSNNQQPPYSLNGNQVTYLGNETSLTTFADHAYSIATNLSGNEVFGGLSEAVLGGTDANPAVTDTTRLADLFQGEGLELGAVRISDGTYQSDVDLSRAKSVGDVIAALRRGAPSQRELSVSIVENRLDVRWADGEGGALLIQDLGGGRTARDLGIEQRSSAFIGTVEGRDLDPSLKLSTEVDRLFGSRARAWLSSEGSHNDISIEALNNGTAANDFNFQLVDDQLLSAGPGVDKGSEEVVYSATALPARAALTFAGSNNNLLLTANVPGTEFNHITVHLVDGGVMGDAAVATYDAANSRYSLVVDGSGATSVQALIDAIDLEGTFTATYDNSNPSDGGFVGTASIPTTDLGSQVGDTSQSGGAAGTFYVHVNALSSTGSDVVAALNNSAEFTELFSASLDSVDGATRSNDGSGRLSFDRIGSTEGGAGEDLDLESGLQIVVDQTTYTVRFDGVQTVQDLLNKITHSGAPVTADLAADGSLRVRSRISGLNFSIGENGGTTASQLGLRSLDLSTRLSDLNLGRGIGAKEGTDFTLIRNDGVSIAVDVSSAQTIEDVLNLINDHPDNQDAGRIEARLSVVGNGIELVDDDPVGEATLRIEAAFGSGAAVGLGLIPSGATVGYANDSTPPVSATLDVEFAIPNDKNNSFSLTADEPGAHRNGVQLVFVDGGAIGNSATAVFDEMAGTLTVTIDPSATTARTVVTAIESEGTFAVALTTPEGPNNGNGLIPQLGVFGTTAGGSSRPEAEPAQVRLSFGAPADINTGLVIEATAGGTAWNGVEVEFVDALAGNLAVASYNSGTRRLTIQIDAASTTSETIRAAIDLEGTFDASLDTESDPTNDGSGIPGETGVLGELSGGTPETLIGRDVNPQTVPSVFDTLSRLIDALSGDTPDLPEAERLFSTLDRDMDRINFALADIGARTRGLEVVSERIEDETIQLKATLSNEIDVDLVEAISNMTAQQATFEASLRLMAQSFQLTLLEFL